MLAETDVTEHTRLTYPLGSVVSYRIRQGIKEKNVLTLVLKRTSPTGQIRAVLSSRKQGDQLHPIFFSRALKFLGISSLRSLPIH